MPNVALKGAQFLVLPFKLFLVLVILSLISTFAEAATNGPLKFLDAADNKSEAMTIAVAPNADVLLPFIRTQSIVPSPQIKFYLTPFRGEQGDNLTVTPYILELPKSKPQNQLISFLLKEPVMTLKLKVPELPTAGKYSGNILVLHGEKLLHTKPIVLTRGHPQRPAQLSIDQKSITTYYTKSKLFWPLTLLWPKKLPHFTVLVHNDSQDWRARDIFLRLIEVTTPQGANFDPGENIDFTWNGKKAQSLWRPGSKEDGKVLASVLAPNHQAEVGRVSTQGTLEAQKVRAIAPNQQAVVSGEIKGLVPGEYIFKLGVAAVNAAPENEEQIILKVEFRHNVVWAVILLIVAIVISFISNKSLITFRRSRELIKKINDIRPSWLRGEPNLMAIVSVRAMLRQAEDRHKRWFTAFFTSEVVCENVDKAEKMLKIISRAHDIRKRTKESRYNLMIRNRIEKKLRMVVEELSPWGIDERTLLDIEKRLSGLEEWFIPELLFNRYWADLQGDIEKFSPLIEPVDFGEHSSTVNKLKTYMDNMEKNIKNESEKTKIQKAIKIEENFAMLNILYERQQVAEKNTLEKLFDFLENNPNPDITIFFKTADNLEWSRLKAGGKAGIGFTLPKLNTINPLRTYDLIQFEVSQKDSKYENSYLFNHGLEYKWTLTLTPGGLFFKRTYPEKWFIEKILKKPLVQFIQTTSREPRLVQYVPKRGELSVSVKLSHNGDESEEVDTGTTPFMIKGAGDVGWRGACEVAEILPLALAAIFALSSGITTFYLSNPNFGTMKDYITLFLWGAGVDQGKNFIQYLRKS